MDWTKATTTQLETIFNHEYDLPTDLLVGLVTEMMNRKMFDGMILQVANNLCRYFDKDEIIQLAYIGIFQFAKKYKHSEIPLKRLIYLVIDRRIKNLFTERERFKNKINRDALLGEMPVIKDNSNVERTVIQKMVFQEQLSKLTEKELYIVTEFLKGFSLNHMANKFHRQTKYFHYHFYKALKKMGITDYEIGRRTGLEGA